MATYRRLVVNKWSWGWWCSSRGTVSLRDPAGRRYSVPVTKVVPGLTWDTWERGQWKKTRDGMITPDHVKNFIMFGDLPTPREPAGVRRKNR